MQEHDATRSRGWRFRRSAGDRLVTGVAGGLAERWQLEPVLVRLAFVLLTLAGGIGAAAYGLAWTLSDEAPTADHRPAPRAPSGAWGIAFACVVAAAFLVLRRVGLFEKRDAYPAFLSGGQQQRAAIARALAVQPHVMLFDEPTSALDPELVGEVLSVIGDLAKEKRTMILVTHEMKFARNVANHIVFLANGVIEEQGPPEEIFGAPKSERLKKFISSIH